MKRLILILFLFGFITHIFSQVDAHFSLFEYTQNIVNPGASGSNDAACFTTSHRQQWIGMKVSSNINGSSTTEDESGRPISTVFSFDMPIRKIKSGIGIAALQDKIGFQNDISIKINYAYRIEIGKDNILGVGVGLGIINRNINPNWVTYDGNNPSISGQIYSDPILPHMDQIVAFDMNLGLTMFGKDYWAGVSTTHLTSPKLKYTGINDAEYYSRIVQQIYLMGGYTFHLSNPSWDIVTSAAVQTSRVSAIEFQLNGKFMYQQKFWFGVSGRIDAICPMVGMHLNAGQTGILSFGIAYDISLNKVGAGGSAEIMARYCFNLTREKGLTRVKTTRRL